MLPPSHQQKSYVSLSRMFSPHWAVFVKFASQQCEAKTQFEARSNVRLTQFEAGSVTIFCHIPASGVRVQGNKGAGWHQSYMPDRRRLGLRRTSAEGSSLWTH